MYFAYAVTLAIMLFLALPASANREAVTATGTAWPEYSKLDNLPKRTPQEIYATACGYVYTAYDEPGFDREAWIAQWRNKYNGELTTESAAVDAIRQAVASLKNPEIFVVPPWKKTEASVGLTHADVNGAMVVGSVERLSQASLAGIRHKDIITAIDGKPTPKYFRETLQLIEGPFKSKVRMQFKRNGSYFETTLMRTSQANDPQENVYMMLGDMAYVRPYCGTLATATYLDLVAALKGLEAAHASGLILDLRDACGGMPDGKYLQSLFVALGSYVLTVKTGEKLKGWKSDQQPLLWGMPMVVLINGGTIGAAEVAASSFRYNERATLVGDRTFGFVNTSERIWLDTSYSLELIRKNITTMEGNPIDGVGLAPDQLVSEKNLKPEENPWFENVKPGSTPSPGLKNAAGEIADKQLRVALSVLKTKSLIPNPTK